MFARTRPFLIWAALLLAVVVPILLAASSPLLAWRQPVYVTGGFAGVAALVLLLVQPLLAAGVLPGLPPLRGRVLHRRIGAVLVLAVVVHVGGLWITSPPDVVDALTFTSPTPFSAWGVVAMWAVFATAGLAMVRRRLRPALWRLLHMALATAIVVGSIVHALLIQGTMEIYSKVGLCLLLAVVTIRIVGGVWRRNLRSGPRNAPSGN
ncbi:ferric reductase-like transmembrane domain-containing protein [Algicella marina]|uniref:Ferric reductase n=1 Tax=Algicella marina TaxID=2683284 RepID=A0A6P1T0E3_9RHOB|nr:ferric reductase-like transmembrane domain-containing protein [Algicella marina]QHQ35103.1 ferric reductase [Algicella marina]